MSIRWACLAATWLLQACAASAPPAPSARLVPLRNADFEAPARVGGCATGWSCSMHAGNDSFRFFLDAPGEGGSSLCVERLKPEPWAVITTPVDVASVRNARLRLSFLLRRDAGEGDGAGPYVLIQDATRVIFHDQKTAPATRGWQRQALEFRVPPASLIVEVGMVLQGGGRACMDDVRLEILQDRSPTL